MLMFHCRPFFNLFPWKMTFPNSGGARSALVAFWLKGRGGARLASFDGSALYAHAALLYARPVGSPVTLKRIESGKSVQDDSRCMFRFPSTKLDAGPPKRKVNQIPTHDFARASHKYPVPRSQVPWALEASGFWMLYLPMWRPGARSIFVNQLTLWDVNLFQGVQGSEIETQWRYPSIVSLSKAPWNSGSMMNNNGLCLFFSTKKIKTLRRDIWCPRFNILQWS